LDRWVICLMGTAKGSRKNKFTFLGVETPGWQSTNVQEYQVYSDRSRDKNRKHPMINLFSPNRFSKMNPLSLNWKLELETVETGVGQR